MSHQGILSDRGTDLIITVRVMPGAKRSGIEGLWNNEAIKIALRAPAVEGKANAALLDFLADLFSLRKSAIEIISGDTARLKRIRLMFASDTSVAQARDKLNALLSD